MSDDLPNSSSDRALGMGAGITRRDFLGASMLASGAALLGALSPADILAAQAGRAGQAVAPAEGIDAWTGYGGVGEYANANGNTWPVVMAGHAMRDGVGQPLPADVVDTGESVDCVIVGGGISGLAAALTFQRLAGKDKRCLVLENHPIFGGEAKQNEFEVGGKRLLAPQGSALYFTQMPHSALARFYDSIGLHTPKLHYQAWGGKAPEMPLARNPYDAIGMESGQYGFWFGDAGQSGSGSWVRDAVRTGFSGAPVSAAVREQLSSWFANQLNDRTTFVPPRYEGDAVARYLDSITLEQHYVERYGVSREFIRDYLAPVEGGGSGLGPDALSAYADYAADLLHMNEADGDDAVQMFPGGNATIARLMVKSLIPAAISGPAGVEGVTRGMVDFARLDVAGAHARVRLSSTVLSVSHDGDPAKAGSLTIAYAKGGKLYKLKARSAVMAGGCWTAKHVVKDLPTAHRAAYAQFYRSPCLIANVAVRNWRFLYDQGLSGCRWFDAGNGGNIGNYFEVRKTALTGVGESTISPDSPVVLSLKILYSYPGMSTEDQGHRGRGELLSTPFREIERRIRMQFHAMFSGFGFHAERDIAGIILNRWGHAYLSPQPGFFFGKDGQPAPRDILRAAPFGRIAFANTDLAGAMDHRYSILEAQRAVAQLCDSLLT
ncbi:MAG: NAD(P)/FAD-dependent oxidoreductase [Burkholderiaceae bacterium]|nr:NAD(P)/FAD-dependent oxidoreductase [Burkholderiaceae bacterium]